MSTKKETTKATNKETAKDVKTEAKGAKNTAKTAEKAPKTEAKGAMVYNKEDLVIAIAGLEGVASKAEAERIVGFFFDGLGTLVSKMKPEDKIQLVGNLTVEARHKDAYVGKNPRDKSDVQVPAKNVLAVKFGTLITNRLVQPLSKAPKADKAKDAKTETKPDAKPEAKEKKSNKKK